MGSGVGTVEVRRMRGKIVVNGLGRTPRGQKFIRKTIELDVKSLDDPNFKDQLKTAIEEMLD